MRVCCATCTFWASTCDGRGECCAVEAPEPIVRIQLYWRVDEYRWDQTDDPDVHGVPVTRADFVCASWQPREERD
jgi:hypothetical protein